MFVPIRASTLRRRRLVARLTGLALATAAFVLAPAAGNDRAVAQTGSAAVQAGVAAAVRGDVRLVSLATQPKASGAVGKVIASGDHIYLGDKIQTGPKAGLQIMLLDQTIFTIGPNAAMVIDKFVYDPSTDAGQVTASIVKGAFRFVSGRIAKRNPSDMSVKLPVATIGIRGTSVAGEVYEQTPTTPPSAQVILLGPGADNNADERSGRITVDNAGTSVEISRPGFGTTIASNLAPPSPPVRVPPARIAALGGDLGGTGGTTGDGGGDSGGTSTQSSGGSDQSGDDNGGSTDSGDQTTTTTTASQQDSGTTTSSTGSDTGGSTGSSGGTISVANLDSFSGLNLGTSVEVAQQTEEENTTSGSADDQTATAAADSTKQLLDTATTFEDLQTIPSGTASFTFSNIPLNVVSAPNYQGTQLTGSGSFDALAVANFNTRSLSLTVSNVSYNFDTVFSGQRFTASNNTFNFSDTDNIDTDSGPVADTWRSDNQSQANKFTNLGTENVFDPGTGYKTVAQVSGDLTNDVENGVIAATGTVNVQVEVTHGGGDVGGQKTVLTGGGTVARQ